jgi:hypothetical protein
MEALLNSIRIALAHDATDEQRKAGADAFNAVLSALATSPTTTTALAAPALDVGQMLDVLIARLSTLAEAKAGKGSSTADAAPIAVAPEAARRFEIPFVPVPRRGS